MPNFKNAGARLKREPSPTSGNAARTGRELLAITPDSGLFADIQFAAARHGWTVRWARSLTTAIAFLSSRPTPVVLYDWYPASEDWTASIDRLTMLPENPCIILAADRVNERLWRRALDHDVYDVVCRTGPFEHLLATLRFAWNWKVLPRDRALVERMRR